MQMKSNIVLIGMPGVGKSTAGVVAAKLAGFQFLDTDLVIMQRDGRLLRYIIDVDTQSIEATAQTLAAITRAG